MVVLFAVDLTPIGCCRPSSTQPGIVLGLVFSLFGPPGGWTPLVRVVLGGGVLLLLARGLSPHPRAGRPGHG